MSGNADLPGQNGVAANLGRSREANLRAEHGVFANYTVVGNVGKAVNLHAASDPCLAQAGAVNGGIGLDLNVILHNNFAGLQNLVPSALVVFCETETVGAYDNSVVEQNIVPDLAFLSDGNVRMSKEVVADPDVAINRHVGQQRAVVADHGARINRDIRAYGSILPNPRRWMYDRGQVNPRLVRASLEKEPQSAGISKLRVLRPERWLGERRKLLINNQSGCLRGLSGR